ncbi:MAG: Mov34/MPN/PAD-1 family protein [Bacilli bacterium]|nr:Mov34/MPN/PAD-1 family protein [Bacilli bacterium]MDD3304716.1 Mov34/MPN/PAD-1 family protein [Bacilli bacterium]MDD4053605.1 Mov34/MPN/PAD-1 family protein [Bacilli bacterium]MDD4411104.1 Mov34/MPN/PAD-1 family protein [Bacilli bacterium]
MKAVIKLHETVFEAIINHTFINSELECGGYLYGCTKKTQDGIEVIVTDVYYEKLFGTDSSFTFGLSYFLRAKNYLYEQRNLGRNIMLIGCYHSHGIYPAVFSEEDRNLQKSWTGNQATIIYSPKYNEMVGDVITNYGEVIEARITTFNMDAYNLNDILNIATLNNTYVPRNLMYNDQDRAMTLKYKPKKR